MIDKLCSIKEVAKILDASPRSIRDWRLQGRFPVAAINEGRFVRWTEKQIQDWIDERKQMEVA